MSWFRDQINQQPQGGGLLAQGASASSTPMPAMGASQGASQQAFDGYRISDQTMQRLDQMFPGMVRFNNQTGQIEFNDSELERSVGGLIIGAEIADQQRTRELDDITARRSRYFNEGGQLPAAYANPQGERPTVTPEMQQRLDQAAQASLTALSTIYGRAMAGQMMGMEPVSYGPGNNAPKPVDTSAMQTKPILAAPRGSDEAADAMAEPERPLRQSGQGPQERIQ